VRLRNELRSVQISVGVQSGRTLESLKADMNDLLLKLGETGGRVEQIQEVQQKQVNNDDVGERVAAVPFDKLLNLLRVSPSHSGSGS
jgi:hypothetical protein